MLQIVLIVLGAVAAVMGIRGLATRSIQLTRTITLQGHAALVTGAITILVGLCVIGLALVGVPMLAR